MKRVLILASVASMIKQFNMSNIKLLQNSGYLVDVACNFIEGNTCSEETIVELKNSLQVIGVRCYQIDFARDIMNISKNIKAFWKVNCLMKKNKYVFVHCHSPIGGVVGRIAGKSQKIKVIYTAHGFHFYKDGARKNWLLFYPVEWCCSWGTDVLLTINKEDYQLAKKHFHAKDTVRIPGVGVDLDRFNLKYFDRDKYRKTIGIQSDDFMIVSVGELNNNKNHSLIIKSIAALNNRKVHYFIAGIGENVTQYYELAQKLNIVDQIHILGFRTDIPQLDHAANVFAFPSIREGLGLAALEALACGVPVCGMDTRGINEYVIDGVTGFLFENTVKSCTDSFRKILKLSEKQKIEMSTACLKMAGTYSIQNANRITKKIYEVIND